jgi:hypothetical protein
MMSLGIHARYGGQPAGSRESVSSSNTPLECGDVWITTRRAIAEWWQAHHDEFTR